MKYRILTLALFFGFTGVLFAQPSLAERLQEQTRLLLNDPQMDHAALSFMVVDLGTGLPVYAHQPRLGLAPASAQKIVTAAMSLELLGKDFRYVTRFRTDSPGLILIQPSGDPTLGSWRFPQTRPELILQKLSPLRPGREKGIPELPAFRLRKNGFEGQAVPGGWPWDDIGNYYGAGAFPFNWRENQFDIFLSSGPQGSQVTIVKTEPEVDIHLHSSVRAGTRGSGDNTIAYLAPGSEWAELEGTIPEQEKSFKVSASLSRPLEQFQREFGLHCLKNAPYVMNKAPGRTDSILSPNLDSMIYWFLHKSINLYGEAFLKTIALQQTGKGSTGEGIKLLQQFWKERGIAPGSLKMIDGSGLSPQNRVSAEALTQVLAYAYRQPWFPTYLRAFPEYNGMTMKSGTIGGAKAFAGYQQKEGKWFAFAIIINNYNGSTQSIVRKMYTLLNGLK